MRIKYDKETDVVYIQFSNSQITESDEEKPGIILDYDAEGGIVGIEVLNASTKMEQANSVVYEVA
ncbi:MAG TPA: hypothetical protein DC042_16370 [Bacteroidales bacterium]|nr:hypothetical protein [Bacteroidales bacterium]